MDIMNENKDILNLDLNVTQIKEVIESKNFQDSWIFRPKSPLPYHSLLYVVEGEAIFYIDEKEYLVQKDMVIYRKKGMPFHSRGIKKGFHYLDVIFELEEDLISDFFPPVHVPRFNDVFYHLYQEIGHVWRTRPLGYIIKSKSIFLNIISKLIPEYLAIAESSKKYVKIHKSIEYMMKSCFNNFLSIDEIAFHSNISSSHFRSIFKEIYGESPLNYIAKMRTEKAINLLEVTNKPVSIIAEEVGFSNIYHFSKMFKCHVGVSPSQYRNYCMSYEKSDKIL